MEGKKKERKLMSTYSRMITKKIEAFCKPKEWLSELLIKEFLIVMISHFESSHYASITGVGLIPAFILSSLQQYRMALDSISATKAIVERACIL
jgi:hypothetical protein